VLVHLIALSREQTLPDAIADALTAISPQECANYLAAAGYDAT